MLYADLPSGGKREESVAAERLEQGTKDDPVDVDAAPPPRKKSRMDNGTAATPSSSLQQSKEESIQLYKGKRFALKFVFEDNYPIEAPQVTFVDQVLDGYHYRVPVHPHIYSNGHICASILADGWSPVLNVSSVALTMQSMLASNRKHEL